jgi:chlorite dismutase
MTTGNTQKLAQTIAPAVKEARQYVKYTFLKLRPEWRRLSDLDRARGKKAFLDALRRYSSELTLRTFSLVGIRGDCDILLWTITDDLSKIQDLVATIEATPLGGYLDKPYSYLGMTQKSQYTGQGTAHAHEGQESDKHHPRDKKYIFVYPFIKKREWYGLPYEERRRMMGAHFQIGHKYPNIHIHTGYSFGLDDQEFILAFEGDSPAEFLDLVQELRPTEASKFTELETPIFTCTAMPPEALVESWGL